MHWLGEIVEIFQKGYVTLDHGSSKACFSRHRYGFIGNQTENYISVVYNLFIMKDVLLHERISRGGGFKQHPLTSDAYFTLIFWTEVPIFVTKIQVLQCTRPP